MSENEAKSFIQGKLNCMNKCDVFDCKGTDECDSCNYCYSQGNFGEQKKAFKMAIKALEEIQQYRAIGTVEGCEKAMDFELAKQDKSLAEVIDEYLEYIKIGTIEEFKALKEKSVAKMPDYEGDGCWDGHVVIDTWICPSCGKHYEVDYDDYDYCPNCGQHIDHSGLTEDD